MKLIIFSLIFLSITVACYSQIDSLPSTITTTYFSENEEVYMKERDTFIYDNTNRIIVQQQDIYTSKDDVWTKNTRFNYNYPGDNIIEKIEYKHRDGNFQKFSFLSTISNADQSSIITKKYRYEGNDTIPEYEETSTYTVNGNLTEKIMNVYDKIRKIYVSHTGVKTYYTQDLGKEKIANSLAIRYNLVQEKFDTLFRQDYHYGIKSDTIVKYIILSKLAPYESRVIKFKDNDKMVIDSIFDYSAARLPWDLKRRTKVKYNNQDISQDVESFWQDKWVASNRFTTKISDGIKTLDQEEILHLGTWRIKDKVEIDLNENKRVKKLSLWRMPWPIDTPPFDRYARLIHIKDYTYRQIVPTRDIAADHSAVKVFPNPSVDNFTIDFGEEVNETPLIKVFNEVGAKVNPQIISTSSTQAIINISGMKSGIYIVEIDFHSRKLFKKVIINE